MTENNPGFAAEVADVTAEGFVSLRVRGEFDLAAVEVFTDAIDEACEREPQIVELDLTDVHFIDSSGVGAIVVAARSIAERGGAIRIGARSAVVDRVLEVSGLETALESQAAD